MGDPQVSPSLYLFKSKIEEAVAGVPQMTAEEKLQAVQFWNLVSEKLQDIVNSSAADINALAMKMEEEKQHKEPSHLLTSRPSVAEQQEEAEQLPVSPFVAVQDPVLDKDEMSSKLQQEMRFNNSDGAVPLPQHPSVISGYETSSSRVEQEEVAQFSAEKMESIPDEMTAPMINGRVYSETSRGTADQTPARDTEAVLEAQQQVQHQELQQQQHATSVIYGVETVTPRRNVIQSGHKFAQNKTDDSFKRMSVSVEARHGNFSSPRNGSEHSLDEDDDEDEEEDEDENENESEIDDDIGDFSENSHLLIPHVMEDEKAGETGSDLSGGSNECPKSNGQKKKAKKESSTSKSHACGVCHKSLPTHSALVSHQWVHTKPYSCHECDAKFSTKGNLLVHQRRHTGEKPFACEKCPASFSTKGNLKRHIKAHSGERPWSCHLCDSRFTEKKSLKVHMRRHTGERPYKCTICGKSFSQTGVLQTHMALHLDERKHLCELCGKAFRQRSQLRLHVLRHEGVKRWNCSNCSAKFLTKGDLERHFRVHTGERPFICDLCGKTFTRQQSLNEHSNRHYGLKPYSCTICNKKFAEMSACYKHIKVHKKQQEPGSAAMATQGDLLVSNPSLRSSVLGSSCTSGSSSNDTAAHPHVNVIQALERPTDSPETSSEPVTVLMDLKHLPPSSDNDTSTSFVENGNHGLAGGNGDFAAINMLANASSFQQTF